MVASFGLLYKYGQLPHDKNTNNLFVSNIWLSGVIRIFMAIIRRNRKRCKNILWHLIDCLMIALSMPAHQAPELVPGSNFPINYVMFAQLTCKGFIITYSFRCEYTTLFIYLNRKHKHKIEIIYWMLPKKEEIRSKRLALKSNR